MHLHNFDREYFSKLSIEYGVEEEDEIQEYWKDCITKDSEQAIELFDLYSAPGNYLCSAGGDVLYVRQEGKNVCYICGLLDPNRELTDEQLITEVLFFLGDTGGPHILDHGEAQDLMRFSLSNPLN